MGIAGLRPHPERKPERRWRRVVEEMGFRGRQRQVRG